MPKKRITKGKRKSLTIEKGTGLASKSKLKQTKLNFSTKKNPQGMDDQLAKATPATAEDNTQGNDTNVIQNDNMDEQENIEPPKTKNPEKGKRRKFFVTSTPSISGPPRKKKAKK
ncbi:hypothetical protein QAD02_022464 [Eretmocerus hayati]|uniref:Uncharacterized protein n=1 Tax=Eretmocerus hayati TaxID=131215 RepID=A0ACC2PY09_9HYME|nr:hypothetical protein QAD02_022464 [Eretmocerus hayati]